MIKRNSDLIIISIIWIVSIYSIIVVLFTSYELVLPNYIGYGLLTTVSLLRLFKVRKLKTILGILLLIGSANAIQYTYTTITWDINFTPIETKYTTFGIQPLSAGLLVLYVTLNYSTIKEKWNYSLAEDYQAELDRQKIRINNYYEELKIEKDSKLIEIIQNRKTYQKEYYLAANKLFEERKTSK